LGPKIDCTTKGELGPRKTGGQRKEENPENPHPTPTHTREKERTCRRKGHKKYKKTEHASHINHHTFSVGAAGGETGETKKEQLAVSFKGLIGDHAGGTVATSKERKGGGRTSGGKESIQPKVDAKGAAPENFGGCFFIKERKDRADRGSVDHGKKRRPTLPKAADLSNRQGQITLRRHSTEAGGEAAPNLKQVIHLSIREWKSSAGG